MYGGKKAEVLNFNLGFARMAYWTYDHREQYFAFHFEKLGDTPADHLTLPQRETSINQAFTMLKNFVTQNLFNQSVESNQYHNEVYLKFIFATLDLEKWNLNNLVTLYCG